MNLKIELDSNHEPIHLFLNGDLKAEIVCGLASAEEALIDRVDKAHRLLALRRALLLLRGLCGEDLTCHRVTKPEAAQSDLGRGFLAGLANSLVPHPGNHLLPDVPPEHTKAYRAGHELGLLCAAALKEHTE